jgi:predicted transcriptional regulator
MAELMMEAHVHRLIVVDAESHPVGVVTTTDILAALIREARKTT